MLKATVRMNDDVEKEFRSLMALYKVNGNELMNNLIRAEYHRVDEDPKIKTAIEEMHKLEKAFSEAQKKLDEAGFQK